MADTKDTERPDLLALADDLAHMARHAVSDRGRLQLAAAVLRAQAERAAPQPADAADGWISVSERLPPCTNDQDYIGINSAGFAGIFNAISDIAGNVYCMMETAEESISIMSDLS
ncbi:MAG: hypothetical protein EOO29_43180, partial [Comamonadaceae bacterium]